MKRYKSILLVLFSILACQSEINQNENTNENAIPMSFYAGIEIPKNSSLTKTVLDGSPSDAFRNVLWEYQDEVYVTNGSQSAKFINTSQGTSEIALLEGRLAEGANYFAAYPFNIVTNSSASSFSVDLPSEQTYCADGIDSEAFPMVAQCKEGVFDFKNICGILVVQLLGEQTITSVSFSGKDSDGNALPVAGKGTVAVGYSDVPTLVMDNLSDKYVSLLSSTGVKLSTTTPTAFHIVLPSGTYDTFELAIATKDGSMMAVNSSKALSIKRSQRTTAAALTYADVIDLSSTGTANCYIVSEPGKYKFNAFAKGNSVESIGEAVSAEVLWESFGTDVTPSVGDIVRNVTYKEGYIEFETPTELAEGNAVVAAKDASGTILWSWHIWVTDQPREQVYYNNAGTMMDRNLGATSATPGDVCALGLLYQWGRKDPFLGSSSISSSTLAKSTITWPSAVASSSATGTVDYAILNPTTFVTASYSSEYDWHYASRDNTLWTTSDKTKSIYDPCPAGWCLPEGADYGIWSQACESSSFTRYSYDEISEGINFGGKFGSAPIIWYPAAGSRSFERGGELGGAGYNAFYWSVTPNDSKACELFFNANSGGGFNPCEYNWRALGQSVRCFKEGSSSEAPSDPVVPAYEDLSALGSANSYIISASGDYKFKTVKGNSSESVGSVSSVEVLWESFGTDVTPFVGDLVKNVSYKDGYLKFSTPSSFKEGNAVIAAKDASGTILWSWHIWLTDQPEEQVYYNNAGTMMDRNLGATSATPGDVGALGLFYQWGRKDPFLGSSSISTGVKALSTISWPSVVEGPVTIDYAIQNPTSYIDNAAYYSNWCSTVRIDLWDTSKTIYDPCPVGWVVPKGNNSSIWENAKIEDIIFDSTNFGLNIDLGNSVFVWYPAAGYMWPTNGTLSNVKYGCYCWTSSRDDFYADSVHLSSTKCSFDERTGHSSGLSIRCQKE